MTSPLSWVGWSYAEPRPQGQPYYDDWVQLNRKVRAASPFPGLRSRRRDEIPSSTHAIPPSPRAKRPVSAPSQILEDANIATAEGAGPAACEGKVSTRADGSVVHPGESFAAPGRSRDPARESAARQLSLSTCLRSPARARDLRQHFDGAPAGRASVARVDRPRALR